MTTDLAAAEALATTIASVKRAAEDNGGKIADMSRAMSDMQTVMRGLQQSAEARARLDVESKAGTNAELDRYLVKSAEIDPSEAHNYVKSDHGVVRMTGAFVRGPSGNKTYRGGLLDSEPKSKAQLDLQKAVTRRSLVRAAMAPPIGLTAGEVRSWKPYTPEMDAEVNECARALGPTYGKIFSDSSGVGAEWIPDTYVPDLDRDVQVPSGVSAMFRTRLLAAGGTKIPNISGNLRVYKHSAPSADDPANATLSSITTGNQQLDPVSSVLSFQIDRESDEDSIIAVLPELQERALRAIQFHRDDSIVNGDTTATHQDTIASWNTRGRLGSTGLGGSNDHRRRWMGLRRRAFDLTSMTTDGNAVQTFAGMKAAIGKVSVDNLIAAHSDPSSGNVVVLVSWEYFFAKMVDPTAFPEFASWDKVGALASVLTGKLGPGGALPGQVGFVMGFVPVCIAYPMTADLASTGKYTGSGSTTGFLTVDRSRFEHCIRQGLRVESLIDVRNNTHTVVMRNREVFRPVDAVASTVKDTHFSYNLTY